MLILQLLDIYEVTCIIFNPVLLRYIYQFEHKTGVGGLAQVVERSIRIREAPGSIPGFSIFVQARWKLNNYEDLPKLCKGD